jgi:hypothetical protein
MSAQVILHSALCPLTHGYHNFDIVTTIDFLGLVFIEEFDPLRSALEVEVRVAKHNRVVWHVVVVFAWTIMSEDMRSDAFGMAASPGIVCSIIVVSTDHCEISTLTLV